MFKQIKTLFSNTFVTKKEIVDLTKKTDQKKDLETPINKVNEPSYIESSSESIIKKTQRALKYRY